MKMLRTLAMNMSDMDRRMCQVEMKAYSMRNDQTRVKKGTVATLPDVDVLPPS